MRKNLFILFLFLPLLVWTQEEKKFGIKFSGFVKTDLFFDSRETVDVREGHFLLYPMNKNLDPEGNDLNANPKFHFLSIQTRLKGTISGPDALGARTGGVIEGEFFGTSNTELNGFRLRHALVTLDWQKTQLLVGQYWHPMFNTNCFPGTVSFNTGAPFEPFSRNPQVRLTRTFGSFRLALTAMSQKDFVSTGPGGPSTEYLRNTMTPAMNLTLEYKYDPEGPKEIFAGASANFKNLQPNTVSDSGYHTKTRFSSYGVSLFFKYQCRPFTVKIHNYYGGDAFNLTMLGGYAVYEVEDASRGFVNFSPIYNHAHWIDFHTNGKKWQYGLFAGYTKNLGAVNKIIGVPYSRGYGMDYVYRVSGRVLFNAGKFRIAPEVEYTAAAYADFNSGETPVIDEYGKVNQSEEVANMRLLIGVYYFF